MTEYVLGFAFDKARENVVLIEKQRPKWQAGRYNGVGGHVEKFESYSVAMQREFWEETGVVIPEKQWKPYAQLVSTDWMVRCFSTFTDDIHKCTTRTDELVCIAPIEHIALWPLLPNLPYLIPLALDDEHVGWPTFNYRKAA